MSPTNAYGLQKALKSADPNFFFLLEILNVGIKKLPEEEKMTEQTSQEKGKKKRGGGVFRKIKFDIS
jgi:hypothetical protein